jgi:hypothetical protein
MDLSFNIIVINGFINLGLGYALAEYSIRELKRKNLPKEFFFSIRPQHSLQSFPLLHYPKFFLEKVLSFSLFLAASIYYVVCTWLLSHLWKLTSGQEFWLATLMLEISMLMMAFLIFREARLLFLQQSMNKDSKDMMEVHFDENHLYLPLFLLEGKWRQVFLSQNRLWLTIPFKQIKKFNEEISGQKRTRTFFKIDLEGEADSIYLLRFCFKECEREFLSELHTRLGR